VRDDSDAANCMATRRSRLPDFCDISRFIRLVDAQVCEFPMTHATLPTPDASSPHDHLVAEPARQAYSHSGSVGSRQVRPACCSSGRDDYRLQNDPASADSDRVVWP